MGLLLESWLSECLAIALVAVAAAYGWYSHRYTYWIKRDVPQARTVIPFGNMGGVFLGLTRMEFMFQELYHRFRDQRYVGIYLFSKPGLLLIDRELVRLVLVKEFDAFSHRNLNFDESDPLNHHLFNLNGSRWKRLRTKMSPSFTTGKLKMMCQTMQQCGRELVDVLEGPARKGQVLEMREVAARFTTDVITSVGFGIECNSQRNPGAAFRQWGRKLFDFSIKTRIADLMYRFFPVVAKALRLKGGAADVIRYFQNVVKDTVEYREEKNVVRNDFLHLMMQLKNKGFIDEQSKTGSQEIDNWKTLRKHPPAGWTDRRCALDTQLPGGGPHVEQGTPVFIPIYALHHDPEYYPQPQRFDPERFSEEHKAARHPYVYMPFGEGPRNCIGLRLGLLQAKIGLAYMLSKYEVVRCEQTTVPLQYSTWSAVLTSTTGIQLKLVQRK